MENQNLQTNDRAMRTIDSKSNRKVSMKNQNITIKIAGAAIFGALSFGVNYISASFVNAIRVPGWNISWFDPVSVVWIMAFFIFGYETGLLTSAIGWALLHLFDISAPIGPLMKLLATLPLIIMPWIMGKIRKGKSTSEYILKKKNVIINWIASVVLRIIIMSIANYYILKFVFQGLDFVDMSGLGFPQITGLNAMLIVVTMINILQSIWDYLIAYLIVSIVRKGTNLPW